MFIERSEVKLRSRQIIRDSNPKVLTASLIVLALSVLFTVLSNRLVGVSSDQAMRYLQYMQSGNTEAAISYMLSFSPKPGAQLVDLLLSCVNIIIGLGFIIFLLNTLRGTAPDLGNLLDGFGYWWKVLVLDLVCGLLVALWSLLFIIPGIVAAYRYSMANYLLITRPELGIMDCIRESKRLTSGWKAEIFKLDLSFLGWWLLGLVPVLGWVLLIWVIPYRNLSMLQYFEHISGYTADAESRDDREL